MKTLFLLRHAKAAPGGPRLDYRERPLDDRGHGTAPVVAQYMKDRGYRPALVLCSPALRCRQTLDAVTEHLGDPPVRFEEDLYLAPPGLLHRRVSELDPAADSVLIVGHNPGIGEFARMFANPGDAHSREMGAKFPTAALAVLTSDGGSWAEIGAAPLAIADFVTPKTVS